MPAPGLVISSGLGGAGTRSAVSADPSVGLGDDIAHVVYVNPDFLRAHRLTSRNVLEYFYASPFYARCGGPTSLNEQRRRHGAEAVGPPTPGDHEFVLAGCNDDAREGQTETSVFIVQKVLHRSGQSGAVPSDTFYIIAGTIYKAPKLSTFFDTALLVAASSADQLLGRQLEDLGRKRRRMLEAEEEVDPVAGSEAANPESGNGALDRTGGVSDCLDAVLSDGVPKWPPWCFFEKRSVPSGWVREALMGGISVAGAGQDTSGIHA
eukprot:TRINITY_DN8693_c0_g1_i1.p1 TRINITY_DN8693_c0_g1~~TRINITY_DN8693_c0_g1_i1.p1  ORF type:complete len:265 (+),score=43.88 TRINITY_DN8693_c0_g1_i1:114-908(+)